MDTLDFLNQLYIKIRQCKKKYNTLIPFVYANKDIPVSEEEFAEFVKMFGSIKRDGCTCTLGITGSGGSRIPKPNIGTITALYLSQVPNLNIIKVGSHRYSSKMGSTDLITELGYNQIKDKEKFFKNNGFLYSDVSEYAEWKLCTSILKLNPSIEKILDNGIPDEFECNIKFTGTIYPEHVAALQRKKLPNIVQSWYAYGGYIGDRIIDEFVPGNNYILCNGEKTNIELPSSKAQFRLTDNIASINRELICGNCTDEFWLASLRNTIALMLFLSGNVDSFLHGTAYFEKIYRDKVAQKLVARIENYK